MHLRRSLIWVAGDNEAKLRRALGSEADVICFDLEDGVLPAKKEYARAQVKKNLAECDFRGRERAVRINSIESGLWQTDLDAILPSRPDAIRIPKSDSVEHVKLICDYIGAFERANGMKENSIEVILLIETALGVLNALQLCTCDKRITAVGIGMEDFTASLGVQRSYTPGSNQLLCAKQWLIMAAKAAGIQAIESSSLMPDNMEFLREDSEISKSFGFTGRSVSNPEQAVIVNEVFSPSGEDLEWAAEVKRHYQAYVETHDDDQRIYNGAVIDSPVVVKADAIVELQKLIDKSESERRA